jgi:hypothetical protein
MRRQKRMMSDSRNIEFEAAVDGEGKIALPAFALAEFPHGERVRVRLTGVALSEELRERGVTEEEIDRRKEFAVFRGLVVVPTRLVRSETTAEEILARIPAWRREKLIT